MSFSSQEGADGVGDSIESPARLQVLISIGLLYTSFGVMAALLQGGLPPVLRARGIPIETVTLTYALYIPFGLAFLWAPVVDRLRLPFLGPRISWIVAAQAVTVVGLVAVSMSETLPLPVLFGMGLFVATSAATMDLALDALAVEMTGEEIKPLAAALKLAALAIGSMIGGGVFVAMLAQLGWTITFGAVALFAALTALPILSLVKTDRRIGQFRGVLGRRLFWILREPVMLCRLAVLMFLSAMIFPVSSLSRIMLVDLGVTLERIAWLVGTVQPLGLLAVSLLSGMLLRRFGSGVGIVVFVVLCLLCIGSMGAGYAFGRESFAIAGAIGMATGVGGIMVVMSALILSWAEGEDAATNYAVMFSGSRFIGIVVTACTGWLVAVIGWVAFFGISALGLLVAGTLLFITLRSSGAATAPRSFSYKLNAGRSK